ncbi:hypothetical protein BJ742DRAFT_816027 [Cladochytrium replicatum]|nr:hypothetical protein BJ742DRAFT_816027 [Cladochytrium replicatum]
MWLDLNPESLSATLTMIHTGEYCEYHISYSKISAWRCGKEGDGFQVTFEFDETPERMSSQATDGLHQQQRSMERSMMMFRVVSFRASGVLEEILNGKGVKRARKMSVPAVLFLTAGSKRRIHEVEDDDTGCTRHQSSPDEPAYAPHESSPDDTGFAPPQSSPDDGHKSDSPIPSLAPSITRSSSSSLGTMNFSLSPINSTIPHVNQLTVRSSSPATPSTLQSLIRSGLGPVVKRQRRGIESLDLNAAGQVSIPVVRRKKVGFVDHVKASSSSSLGQSDGYLLRKDQRTEIAVNGALVSIFTAAAKQMEEKLNKLGENVLAKVDESINEKEEIIGKLFGGLIQQCENLCCQEEDEMSM